MENRFKKNKTEAERKVPVLIIGGGISGLTASLLLLKQGITPLLVERHKNTSIHPKCRGFDIRAMEIYRELQLSEPIREAGKALSPSWGILTNSSLAEALKKKKPRKGEAVKSPIQGKGLSDLAALTPEAGARCTQDLSEQVMLKAAKERGAEVLFNTELLSFKQDTDCVTAIIKNRETGTEETILAGYMIAADGANSFIREALNVKTVGKGALGNLLNILFETDLADFVRGREFSLLRIEDPEMKGLFASINNTDRWVFHLHYDTAKGEKPQDYTEARIIEILKTVIGLPHVNIRIISILPWQPTVKTVTEMQHGRIFLAGDAAHVMTPYGGKGASTGIQDVHNLAWKMAAVINGKASPLLLHSYSIERQPIGLHNAEKSGKMANEFGLLRKINFRLFGTFILVRIISFFKIQKIFPRLPLSLAGGLGGLPEYKYPSTISDNKVGVNKYTKAGLLDATPGTRVPHIWVEKNGQKISTLDLSGKDFVLFTGTNNKAWQEAANSIHDKMQIDLPVYSIGISANLIYKKKSIKAVMGINDSGAILVRPDGFVAWKYEKLPSNPSQALTNALQSILFNSKTQ